MITLSTACKFLHYGCALAASLLIAVSLLLRCGQVKKSKGDFPHQQQLYVVLQSLLILSYAGEGTITAVQENDLLRDQAHLVHMVVLGLGWSAVVVRQSRALPELLLFSLITTIFEVALLAIFPFQRADGSASNFQLIFQVTRAITLILLIASTGYAWLDGRKFRSSEAKPLLCNEQGQQTTVERAYGTESLIAHPDLEEDNSIASDEDGSDTDSDDDRRIKRLRIKRLQETGGWWGYLKDFSIFLPYLVPRKDLKVQICYAVSAVCVAGNRVLNILVPIQLGHVADELLERKLPAKSLTIWLLLSVLNDQSGLQLVQGLAKIPMKQFSYRQITNAAFDHVMNLGMDFHSERDYGEVVKAVEQGGALNNVLETAVLEITPTVLDLFIAVFILYSKFNVYVALAMIVASIAYTSLEVKTSNWNIANRRRLTKAERNEAKVMHQAVQGWLTVSYFNMFSYERHRFGRAVEKRLQADQDWSKRDVYIDAILELLVPTTFFSLSCLVFYEISLGRASPGDFVFLIQYWDTLIWPLKFLSKEYRWLMSDLVDAERLLELLQTRPTVVDRDEAKDLDPIEGRVAFEHVYFAYDTRKTIIEDVNFSASPGETIALVGMTGAGKSSILKLLVRFYDISSGNIKIDGYDIRDISLSSLRDALGVVPQDPLLFNASIKENLRYARLSATDEEIEAACRAAAIHEKILAFPDGYETTVGEQGVKLSGGEVQRLAIARVLLKDPPILILDEATSAVDTVTESEIQSVLNGLKKRRTTFVIAHRLSTVVGADTILVMRNGRIVEKGTHQELLVKGEIYKDLWMKQIGGLVDA